MRDGEPAAAGARQGGAGPLRQGHRRHRVPFPFGWSELEGIANRTDFDLRQHQQVSGEDLTYFDDETQERYLPYVIEPSAGVDRATLAFLVDAYDEEPDKDEIRVVLRLHKELAPIKVAFLPLSRKA